MSTFFHNLRRFGQSVNHAFCRLTEIQFDAPWAPRRSRCN